MKALHTLTLAMGLCLAASSSGSPAPNNTITTDTTTTAFAPATSYSLNLHAQAISATRVKLTWSAISNHGAVVKYQVIRAGTAGVLPETTLTNYSDTTVIGSTHYSYQVQAVDAHGKVLSKSYSISVKTPSAKDTIAPTIPNALQAEMFNTTTVNLRWAASIDNVAVVKYQIVRSDESGILAETPTTNYRDTTVQGNTRYSYQVRALDAANNSSGWSRSATIKTPATIDIIAPSTPSNLLAVAPSATRINLTWTASTDNVGVAKYQIMRVGTAGVLAETTSTNYSDTTVVGNTTYSYQVKAVDAAHNMSGLSNTASAKTPAAADTTAPSTPTSLNAVAASATRINLTWTASTDNVGVAKYQILRVGTTGVFAETTSISYSDTTVVGSTSYSYQVKAVDAANNASNLSNTATVQTPAPDAVAPKNAVGMNIGGVADWMGDIMFADAMKSSRAWTSATPGGGNLPASSLDAHGWPKTDAFVMVFSGLLTRDNSGTYALSYESNADATVSLFANATLTNKVRNAATGLTTAKIVMTGTGDQTSFLGITFSNTDGGVRHVKLMRPIAPGSATSHAVTEDFSRPFLLALSPFRAIRFMGYLNTIQNPQVAWTDRVKPNYSSFEAFNVGGSWEHLIKMCNQTHKDGWIQIPFKANDEYIRQLAILFRDGGTDDEGNVYPGLDPEVHIYIEYSNELWNFFGPFEAGANYQQAVLEHDVGDPYRYNYDDPNTNNSYAWGFSRVARRAVDISRIFRSVVGDAKMMTQFRPVFEWQAANPTTGSDPLIYLEKAYIPLVDFGKPVSYFFYGGGGSTYYYALHSDNFTYDSFWSAHSMDPNYFGEIYVKPNANILAMYGLKPVSYEGGHSFDDFGNAADNAIYVQAWTDPKIKASVI
ncbi:MAG: hypothetical protein K2P84_09585, partial [Undibacterium sp.]|nr:hypothetical protein [Undibacterium sp.]